MGSNTARHDHAVVLGAGMAGLAAAAALTRHFRRVTVVDRDPLAPHPHRRPGVPQGAHVHGLLPGGAQALEALRPGFADGLVGAGAIPIAWPREVLWLNPAGARRCPTGSSGWGAAARRRPASTPTSRTPPASTVARPSTPASRRSSSREHPARPAWA